MGDGATRRMIVIERLADLAARIGEEIAVSEWVDVSQHAIDEFADATHDDQWIHVDVERARRESPYGTTVAHGMLTLALIPGLLKRTIDFPSVRHSINYGLNKVRFPAPVPAGSRVCARFAVAACDALAEGGVQIVWRVTVEREGGDKPVCVAELVNRRHE